MVYGISRGISTGLGPAVCRSGLLLSCVRAEVFPPRRSMPFLPASLSHSVLPNYSFSEFSWRSAFKTHPKYAWLLLSSQHAPFISRFVIGANFSKSAGSTNHAFFLLLAHSGSPSCRGSRCFWPWPACLSALSQRHRWLPGLLGLAVLSRACLCLKCSPKEQEAYHGGAASIRCDFAVCNTLGFFLNCEREKK